MERFSWPPNFLTSVTTLAARFNPDVFPLLLYLTPMRLGTSYNKTRL